MNDEIEILKLVTARLEGAAIAYMVTGSLALSHYARPRMTRDIDLVVAMGPMDVERFADALGEEFECNIDAIRTAVSRQGLFNLIHPERVVKVDFVVRKDTPFRLEEFARRRRVTFVGQSIWVVSPEDLLLSKLFWAGESRSPVQLADAKNLVESAAIDWGYVEQWAANLGISELLREVRA